MAPPRRVLHMHNPMCNSLAQRVRKNSQRRRENNQRRRENSHRRRKKKGTRRRRKKGTQRRKKGTQRRKKGTQRRKKNNLYRFHFTHPRCITVSSYTTVVGRLIGFEQP
jgi:hypothetical protein